MKNIREVVRDVIEQRVLPWIERDGISNLLLPEQITGADCAGPIRYKQPPKPRRREPRLHLHTKVLRCKYPPRLRHGEHELGIGLAGNMPYCIENKVFIFTPGRMVLLPAGTVHGMAQTSILQATNLDPDQSSSTLWLRTYPSGVWLQMLRVLGEGDMLETTPFYLLLGGHFSRLMACLLEEVRTMPPNYARVGRAIIIEFMERCVQATYTTTLEAQAIPIRSRPNSTELAAGRSRSQASSRKPGGRPGKAASKEPPSLVEAAQEFICSNYPASISLEDIAEAAGSSANHLGRKFKTATGMTPIEYLLDVRMAAAKQLLLTDLKVFEVAQLVGIQDHSYFGRVFRRITGVTPLRYRRTSARLIESQTVDAADPPASSRKSHQVK